ncbi:response regulator transcription factor [Breznakiella homolactica]|uniref:HTH luxR-type domain-containing protein n=1 Tax=Breznakiella homolactica TaxID=2798577 RepID=A0A7T7XPJ1_9SPIR|nr:helix-turn-helix transcriptional regulator [Breznakiella homolactica]QQO10150.1 LuxR C-terminal-related transcriptional regulator [Breznakiella homolactica]
MEKNREEQLKDLFQELNQEQEETRRKVSFLEYLVARNSLYFLVFRGDERILYHNLPNRKNLDTLSDAEYILQRDTIDQIRKYISVTPAGNFEITLKSTVLEFILFSQENFSGLYFLQITLFNQQKPVQLAREEQEYTRTEIGVEDLSAALRLLDEIRGIESLEQKKQLYQEIQEKYLPALEELQRSVSDPIIGICLDIIHHNLEEVLAPAGSFSALYKVLTPSEIKVAEFIRMGKSSQDIAEALDIAKKTVENHRNSLRDKLGIKNKGVNLRSYLLNLDS